MRKLIESGNCKGAVLVVSVVTVTVSNVTSATVLRAAHVSVKLIKD
jgi:hypothetical protein